MGAKTLAHMTERGVDVRWYDGDRATIRNLFELAEDSVAQLNSYINAGQVLVAWRDGQPVGHLQLVATGGPGEIEIKNMAVVPELRGSGIGRLLINSAVHAAADQGFVWMLVGTGGADTGNLRFYQRCGFRLLSVERDAFTPQTGYKDPIAVDGIPLRDRVWLDRQLPTIKR